MKICFPVVKEKGLESQVYGHFGSAPFFIIVEIKDEKIKVISNNDQHHAHGACNPLKALNNEKIDAVVVGGIGMGALNKLNQIGIKVYKAIAPTIKENIKMIKSQQLPEFIAQHCCPGHTQIGGCGH